MECSKRSSKFNKDQDAISWTDRRTGGYYGVRSNGSIKCSQTLDELFHKKPWVKTLSTEGSNIPMKDMDDCDEMLKNKRQKLFGSIDRAKFMRQSLKIKRKSEEGLKQYRKQKLGVLKALGNILNNNK